jgi:hypothetical protein
MENNESKNDIHVIEACVETLSRKKLEILNLLSMKHDDELIVQLFLKYIKSKYGPKIMKLLEM